MLSPMNMRSGNRKLGFPAGILALAASTGLVWADVAPNPYQPIFERNIFALHDPPPPPQPAIEKVAPPEPAAKVVLTGIINIGGPAKALLEVTETIAGKPPVTKKPILREGEKEGQVEVISINFAKGTVLAKIGKDETTLNFETPKPASGAAPARPTPSPVPALPAGIPPGAVPPTASMEPNIIPRTPVGAPVDRSGIGVYGGSPVAAAPANPGFVNTGAGIILSSASGAVVPVNNNVNTSRTPRTPEPVTQPTVQHDPVATWLDMKINEEKRKNTTRPMPPTPPIPGFPSIEE
jgi:hypothetical protein